eukprot:TRINITY_DN739_c0_g1_i2.p1 TRINITY_DN739_c0_g1~~TRINITY_DN739_c0_g1_i2.p1  ORF type:complete len:318 (+),score=78.55 TRINITY_DN739_c0_g1_i2:87-1040(+)
MFQNMQNMMGGMNIEDMDYGMGGMGGMGGLGGGLFKDRENDMIHEEDTCLDCCLKKKGNDRKQSIAKIWKYIRENGGKDHGYDTALITLSHLSSMLTHTQHLSMYSISVIEMQRLLLETGIMPVLMFLLDRDYGDNEDFQCIPYYSLCVLQLIVGNKKEEYCQYEVAADDFALKCFLKCDNKNNFFRIPFEKNFIEIIKFLLASRTMSCNKEFTTLFYNSNKDMVERVFQIFSDPMSLIEKEFKRKYNKYELILYSLGVAGTKFPQGIEPRSMTQKMGFERAQSRILGVCENSLVLLSQVPHVKTGQDMLVEKNIVS